ncbi:MULTISPECIES: hypothetical protein [unclassified Microcoleus]
MNNYDEVGIWQHIEQNCVLAQFSLLTSTNLFGGQMQDGIQAMALL